MRNFHVGQLLGLLGGLVVTTRREPVERRQHTRFRVPEGTMAVFGGPNATVGRIIDISMAGLAFVYVSDKKPAGEASEVDILLADDLSHLYGLPCETIYDVDNGNTRPSASMTERRRGVKFKGLTLSQTLHLQDLLRYCATDELQTNPSTL
jgi:hypothetical protein